MTSYIYQSPKREKKRSAPVGEHEIVRRKLLEEQGWTIVEVIDEDGHSTPILGIVRTPEAARRLLEVNTRSQPGEAEKPELTTGETPATPKSGETPTPEGHVGGETPPAPESEQTGSGEGEPNGGSGQPAEGEAEKPERRKKG
jgi:hypothetical protein